MNGELDKTCHRTMVGQSECGYSHEIPDEYPANSKGRHKPISDSVHCSCGPLLRVFGYVLK